MLSTRPLVFAFAALASLLFATAADSASGPPCAVGTVTRAGVLNYDAKIIKHDAKKGLYLVEFVTGYKGDREWLPASMLKTCTGEPPPEVTQDFYIGTWALWTGGGGAYVKKGNDWHATWLDVAKAPPLTVRK